MMTVTTCVCCPYRHPFSRCNERMSVQKMKALHWHHLSPILSASELGKLSNTSPTHLDDSFERRWMGVSNRSTAFAGAATSMEGGRRTFPVKMGEQFFMRVSAAKSVPGTENSIRDVASQIATSLKVLCWVDPVQSDAVNRNAGVCRDF